jgi:hypothetical protein
LLGCSVRRSDYVGLDQPRIEVFQTVIGAFNEGLRDGWLTAEKTRAPPLSEALAEIAPWVGGDHVSTARAYIKPFSGLAQPSARRSENKRHEPLAQTFHQAL